MISKKAVSPCGEGGPKYYEASVGEVNNDGTFNLYYWDGDTELNVPESPSVAARLPCSPKANGNINAIIQGRLKASLHPADKKTASALQ